MYLETQSIIETVCEPDRTLKILLPELLTDVGVLISLMVSYCFQ